MIPHTFHQMWVGPHQPYHWMATWLETGFDYELWTLERIQAFGFTGRAYEFYMDKEYWPGVKDAIMPQVLGEFGGVFVDADARRLKDWRDAPFMEADGFAAYTEPHKGQPDRLGASIVGACPGSLVMAEWFRLTENLESFEPEWDTMIPALAEAAKIDPLFVRLPQGTFYPKGLAGGVDASVEPYAEHFWATTKKLY